MFKAEFENIYVNSLNLNERIQLFFHGNWELQDTPIIEPDLIRTIWSKNFIGLPLDSFEKRLRWISITSNDINILSRIKPSIIEFPEWIKISSLFLEFFIKPLKEITLFSNQISNNKTEDLSQLFYKEVSEWFFCYQVSKHSFLADTAYIDLKEYFITKISKILSSVFYDEFNSLDKKFNPSIEYLKSGGIVVLMSKYPVMARLFGELLIQFREEYELFISRLSSDITVINTIFNVQSNIIINIQTGLSDPHNNGQTVKILHFECGKSIIYKPKSIEIDEAYYNFSNWLNIINKNQVFNSIKTICRSEYGWVEFIDYKPCKNKHQLKIFYYNSGFFIALSHILKITDCHYENLIANGIFPTLIDCEAVMHPQVSLEDNFLTNKLLNQSFLKSIFRSGFLPSWTAHINNKSIIDISGLGGFRKLKTEAELNQDYKVSENLDSLNSLAFSTNQPIKNSLTRVYEFSSELTRGFIDGYSLIASNSQNIANDLNNPFIQFENKRTRYIYRATEVYDKIIKYALLSSNLKHGFLFSIALDLLSRSHLLESEKTVYWKIFEHEFIFAHHLDIPVFYSNTSTKLLYTINNNEISFFEESGISLSKETINQLSKEDMDYQLNVLNGILLASQIQHSHRVSFVTNVKKKNAKSISHNDKSIFLLEAKLIAEEIIKRKTNGSDTNWLSITLNPRTGRYQFGTIGYNLFDGLAGVSLFFSALYFACGEQEYKEHAVHIISPILKAFNSDNNIEVLKLIQLMGIGILEGIGSLIYSLILISEYLDDGYFLDLAYRISAFLDRDFIIQDKNNDIVSGCSGLILSLLKLYKTKEDFNIKSLIEFCSNHLYSLLNKELDNSCSLNFSKPLTGFSHGAAGLSYTLFKIYDFLNDEKYKKLAYSYIKYEKNLLNKKNFTYPDFRFEYKDDTKLPNAWCHGASGIVLSRVALHKFIRQFEEEYSEIENGIKFLLRTENFGSDHLCCGNSGRIDILLNCGIILNNNSLIEKAQSRMHQIITSAREKNGYTLNSILPNTFSNVGFFQGISGIGYQMLRTYNPHKFKSILLFE